MRVAINNLGRLPGVEIDLSKDLLLFTGPNNTSKTYTATIIYGLLRGNWLDGLVVDEQEALFRDIYDHLGHGGGHAFPVDAVLSDLGPALDRHLRRHGAKWICGLFAAAPNAFARTGLQLFLSSGDLALAQQHLGSAEWNYSGPTVAVSSDAGSEKGNCWLHDAEEMPDGSEVIDDLKSLLPRLFSDVTTRLLGQAVVLPAERSAIQLFSRELLLGRSSLATGSRKLQELQRSIPRYPLPISDCLDITSDLLNLQKRTSPFASLADDLEQQILRGAVRASQDGALTFTPEGAAPLDLHLSSSSVKSLSLLTFCLRHLLDPGDWLIIDEPELNLHPDNQRLVARLLVRLVRAGARVLCSTHSDTFVREVNNLIMLSSDESGSLREELGYAADEALAPERVGAYLFLPQSAEALPVTRTGFVVQTIDREINRMNNVAEKIYLTLFGAEG